MLPEAPGLENVMGSQQTKEISEMHFHCQHTVISKHPILLCVCPGFSANENVPLRLETTFYIFYSIILNENNELTLPQNLQITHAHKSQEKWIWIILEGAGEEKGTHN